MTTNGNFTRFKRFLAGISGIAVLITSMYLSKEGVGFPPEMVIFGWIIAVALSSAEFMFNSSFDELNWTMILIGLGAYIYSIYTNVRGFMFYRGVEHYDATSIFGGLFMDVYPELAIAWALKESKVGDLLGNIMKSFDKPESLTDAKSPKKVSSVPDAVRNNAGRPKMVVPPPDEDDDFPPFLKHK